MADVTGYTGYEVGWGGGIYASGAVTIVSSHITSNTAAVSGGGIYLLETGSLTLVRTEAANNTPDDIFRSQ
jgi:predicted outer membrane repeat protein